MLLAVEFYAKSAKQAKGAREGIGTESWALRWHASVPRVRLLTVANVAAACLPWGAAYHNTPWHPNTKLRCRRVIPEPTR